MMEPIIGITNLLKTFDVCFGHEICLKPLSMQKIVMAFNYSYLYTCNSI